MQIGKKKLEHTEVSGFPAIFKLGNELWVLVVGHEMLVYLKNIANERVPFYSLYRFVYKLTSTSPLISFVPCLINWLISIKR